MNIVVRRDVILENITGRSRKYCLECKVFFDPAPLAWDPHATHYCWFLPQQASGFEEWIRRIRDKDEEVWGYIMDEDGTRSHAFCPTEFTLEITE